MGIFLFTTASRTFLEPTQPPIQWVPGALSLRVKRPGREADMPSWRADQLKAQGQIYLHLFTFYPHTLFLSFRFSNHLT
jgi:hypothetical protein